MAGLGELLEKLGRNAGLNALERMQLRTKGRELEALGPAMSVLFGPGEADPHFNNFFAVEGEFETLPHEIASLRFDTQILSTGTSFQDLTVTDPSGATWSHGMTIDVSNGTIGVTGVSVNAVIEFTFWVQFAANGDGQRAIQWTDVGGGNSVKNYEFAPDGSLATYLYGFHKRKVALADTFYKLQAWQDTGGDLNIDGLLVAERVR
jgi:hypothetical protein